MNRQEGITLVELLVALVILALLVGVVFPGFRALIDRSSMTTSANDLILAVSFARSEAVRSAGVVRVRARPPAAAPGDPRAWANGWEVVLPDNSVARVFEPIAGALALIPAGGFTELAFNNQGLLVDATPRSLTLCLLGDSGVRIDIAATGRPNTTGLAPVACPAAT